MAVLQTLRRKPLRLDRRALGVYLLIALIGTLIPNSATYEALRHLPSGLISIFLALVPMFAFPIALAMGNEAFQFTRFLGLCFGQSTTVSTDTLWILPTQLLNVTLELTQPPPAYQKKRDMPNAACAEGIPNVVEQLPLGRSIRKIYCKPMQIPT